MKANVIFKSCASVSVEIENNLPYFTGFKYDVYLDGKIALKDVETNVFSIYDLKADTTYELTFSSSEIEPVSFTTLHLEYYINVKDFKAKGDGVTNDTLPIQAAIFACGKDGMVVVPKGDYLITSLFFRDDITLYLKKGARLLASTDRNDYAVLPDIVEYNGREKVIGSWEGNPQDIFTSPITIINASNVKIIGEGTIDGNACNSDWWVNHRVKRIAYRPRGLYIAHSKNIGIQGVTITNTASWTIHPFFTDGLDLIDLRVQNPSNSPNTDGLDPESSTNLNIIGIKFSVGDDCIAIKAGKIYMAHKHYKQSSNFVIRNCYMYRGHGAVVIGSEMSSGVTNITVSKCLFEGTDRGLRIKTRRGRGQTAIIDNVTFDTITMKEVLNPFVINMYYFCDPDGKSEYVSCKTPLPIDERTPRLGKFHFKNITCTDTVVSGGYFYGLPEAPIESVTLENVSIDYKDSDYKDHPAMMTGSVEVNRLGLYFNQVNKVEIKNVDIKNNVGVKYIYENVKEVKE